MYFSLMVGHKTLRLGKFVREEDPQDPRTREPAHVHLSGSVEPAWLHVELLPLFRKCENSCIRDSQSFRRSCDLSFREIGTQLSAPSPVAKYR